MEIRVELITMPDVNDVRAVSTLRREELAHRAQAHSDAMDAKATQDLPRFIRFINQQIEEAKMAGLSCIQFSFNDEEWKVKDSRCIFTLAGRFNHKHAEFLDKLYKSIGFKGWVQYLAPVHNRCYRSGCVYLYW